MLVWHNVDTPGKKTSGIIGIVKLCESKAGVNPRLLLLLGLNNMAEDKTDFIRLCIAGDIHTFYVSKEWRKLRNEVLKADKYECQYCKKRGKYTKATHVHHVKHLRKYPEYALVKALPDGTRQLISVCAECHETVCHPERMRKSESKEPVTEERWD